MSFFRVSRLPFASPQMLLGSFGLPPAPCQPLHVFSEGFRLPALKCFWAALASLLHLANPVMSFLGFQNCRLPALKCFPAASAPLLHLANPFMSFLRVSKLPFASPQMLLGSFGLLPAPCQPLHVFSEGFKIAVCQPSNASRQLWPPSCTLPTPSCLILGFQNCRLPALKCFSAALAPLLHLANPFMSFFRVSKLPFCQPSNASRQLWPPSCTLPTPPSNASRQLGLHPAPCQPLHVFS